MALTTTALLTAAGIAAGTGVLGATGAAIGAGAETKKARKEENKSYQQAQSFLESQYYRDPLTSVGNKAILKSMDERMRDQADAMENRAAAGGATYENQLAARQASNRTMSGMYSQLLSKEDARRDALDAKRLALDMQHSANLQNSYLQNAQNWSQWGSTFGNSMMDVGSSLLLGGAKV